MAILAFRWFRKESEMYIFHVFLLPAGQGTPPPAGTNNTSSEEVEALRKELDNMRLQLQNKDAQLASMVI